MFKYRLKGEVAELEAMFFPEQEHPEFETRGREIQDWINIRLGKYSAGWEDECIQVDYRNRDGSTYISPGRWVVIFAGRVLDFSTEEFMSTFVPTRRSPQEVSRG